MDLNKRIESLERINLNCNVFSVYDYPEESMQELLCRFFTKINECITVSNETLELAKWLVDVGLSQEVAKKLEEWLADGTLGKLINETIFKELNDKLNKVIVEKNIQSILVDSFKTETNTWNDAVELAMVEINKGVAGILEFGKGVYDVNFEIVSNITIKGQGPNITILKSTNYSNKDVIKSVNFEENASDNVTIGDNRGSHYVNIHDLTIDGNKAYNSYGYGIKIWGASLNFNNVITQNCASGGIITQYTTHSTPNESNISNVALESCFDNIKCLNNKGNGWTFNGPHDSSLSNFVCFSNDGWGLISNSRGSLRGYHWNSWLNGIGSFYIGSSAWLNSIACTGPYDGIGLEIDRATGNVQISDIYVSGHVSGLILRGTNIRVSGNIIENRNNDNTLGDGIIIDGATNFSIDITGSGNKNVFKCVSASGVNFIKANILIPNGGTISTGVDIKTYGEVTILDGSGTNQTIQTLTSKNLYIGGYEYTFPNSNGDLITSTTYPTATKRAGVLIQPKMEYLTSTDVINYVHINKIIDALKLSGVMSLE